MKTSSLAVRLSLLSDLAESVDAIECLFSVVGVAPGVGRQFATKEVRGEGELPECMYEILLCRFGREGATEGSLDRDVRRASPQKFGEGESSPIMMDAFLSDSLESMPSEDSEAVRDSFLKTGGRGLGVIDGVGRLGEALFDINDSGLRLRLAGR